MHFFLSYQCVNTYHRIWSLWWNVCTWLGISGWWTKRWIFHWNILEVKAKKKYTFSATFSIVKLQSSVFGPIFILKNIWRPKHCLNNFSLLKSVLLVKSTFVAENKLTAKSLHYFTQRYELQLILVLPVIMRRLLKSIGLILMTRQDPVNVPGGGLEWQNTMKKALPDQALPDHAHLLSDPPLTPTSTQQLSHFTLALAQW